MKAFKKLHITNPLLAQALLECIAENKFARQSDLDAVRSDVFKLKHAKEEA